jgi:dolichol-phosphate mannosyltransferase
VPEEDAATAVALPHRIREGLRHSRNWLQLLRFCAVGASGYAVNLAVFAACVHLLELDYRVAAVAAFLVALTNNFFWNRHWTFSARAGQAGPQAARFLAVSIAAFVVNLGVLELLVAGAGVAEVPAQALAILAATPISFLGNRLWTFAG